MSKTAYEEDLISRVLKSIKNNGGDECLSSVILTGSFGRNEPTYIVDSNGKVNLKSDVEIALVFPSTSKKERIVTLIKNVRG